MEKNKIMLWKDRLIKNYYFFILIIFIIAPGCLSQHIQRNTKPFFFFQMTDPQFGMFTNNNGFTKETINFGKAIEAANHLSPAFVIVCGDLVNKTNNAAQIAEYKRVAGKIDPSISFYQVAGNHDLGNQPSSKSLANYRKEFGPDYYSFTSGNLFGIVLNSSLFKDPTLVEDEAAKQDQWLQRTLKGAKEKKFTNIVVFQHIPFFLTEPNEKDGYSNIPLERRKVYLKLFQKYGIKYIFAGHLHKNAIGRDGDLEIISTGPVGKPLGKDPSGFRIVKVNGSKISSEYYSLDSIPNSINLSDR